MNEKPKFNFSDWTFLAPDLDEDFLQEMARRFAPSIADVLFEDLKKELRVILVDVTDGDPVGRFTLDWSDGDLANITKFSLVGTIDQAISDGDITLEECPGLPARLRALADRIERG